VARRASDASERKLGVARSERPHEHVEDRLRAMEDLELPPESVDLVVASLCVHDDANHAPWSAT
jgi:hypothetical protein